MKHFHSSTASNIQTNNNTAMMLSITTRCLGRLTMSPSLNHRHHQTIATTAAGSLYRPTSTYNTRSFFRHAASSSKAAAAAAETSPTSPSASSVDSENLPHISVLLDEILGFFQHKPIGVYVDGTLGAGGHASAVARAHPELHTLVGFDLDPVAHKIAAARLDGSLQRNNNNTGINIVSGRLIHSNNSSSSPVLELESTDTTKDDKKLTAYLIHGNFNAMHPVLDQLPGGSVIGRVDAMLLDLGFSSMQVDEAERGFSFMRDGPLDMRMDPTAPLSAEHVVNTYSEAELGRIFREFGEERYWKSIARRVADFRSEAPITTTHQLVTAVGNPGGGQSSYKQQQRGSKGGKKSRSEKNKHPATRIFQALRIAVNGELESIAKVIPVAIDALAPGGRLAVITFHSLEDRIVKWAFRQAAGMAPTDEELPSYCLPFSEPGPAKIKLITRKPVVPSEDEQVVNVRSRSAKLRIIEKL